MSTLVSGQGISVVTVAVQFVVSKNIFTVPQTFMAKSQRRFVRPHGCRKGQIVLRCPVTQCEHQCVKAATGKLSTCVNLLYSLVSSSCCIIKGKLSSGKNSTKLGRKMGEHSSVDRFFFQMQHFCRLAGRE